MTNIVTLLEHHGWSRGNDFSEDNPRPFLQLNRPGRPPIMARAVVGERWTTFYRLQPSAPPQKIIEMKSVRTADEGTVYTVAARIARLGRIEEE